MNYNESNNYGNMDDKNRITHRKDLMTINNLSNPMTNNETISTEFKTDSLASIKMESEQMTHKINIGKNSSESTLSPKLKNIVNISPLPGPIIDSSIITSTDSNNIPKLPFDSQPKLSENASTTTQPQHSGTVKIEANSDSILTQNVSNNTINSIPNVSIVPNTRATNTILPSIRTTGFPNITNSYTETQHGPITTGIMNITQPAQLLTQQPVLLSTPRILPLQSPRHMSQPIVTYNQKQPQNQYLTSMSLPVQSTIIQPLQQDKAISKPWNSPNLSNIINMNNNEKVNRNIPQLNTFSTVETNLSDPKAPKEAKEDPIQVKTKRSSTSLEDNSTSHAYLAPPHNSTTIISTASATNIDTRQSDIMPSEIENNQIVKVTTKTTGNSLSTSTKEAVEEKEANTTTNKNPVNENSNMEDNDALYLSKKGSRRLRDSKRAVQNRNAQKAFRQRKEKYVKLLELKAREYDEVMQENMMLRKEIFNLKNIILQMEQQIQMYNDYYMNDLQHQQQLQKIQTQQIPCIPQLPHQFRPPPPPPAPPL